MQELSMAISYYVNMMKNFPLFGRSARLLSSQKQFRKCSTLESVKWLHPANSDTELREVGNRHNTFLASSALTLNSSTPLCGSDVEEALHSLYRKASVLRLCLRRHQDHLWVCERTSQNINFKVLEGVDWKSEMESMSHRGFDSRKSMWRARLMPDTKCTFPDVQNSHPHQYRLILSFHTGILRGIVIARIVYALLDQLNQRATPTDSSDLGRYLSPEEVQDFEDMFRTCKDKHPPLLKAELENRLALNHRPLLLDAFGSTNDDDVARFEVKELSYELSQNMLSKCRSQNLTVNSFMASVFNTAFVRLMKEAGMNRDHFNVISCHSIDGRRYLKGDTADIQSAPVFRLPHLMVTPSDVLLNFWEYATQVHSQLQYRLAQKHPIYERIAVKEKEIPTRTLDYYFTGKHEDIDFYVSNPGVFQTSQVQDGSRVILTNMCFSESIHKSGIPALFMIYMVNGRLNITLNYSKKYLTAERANQFLKNVCDIISITVKQV